MKGRQTALYPGNEDKVGYWLTPWDEEPFVSLMQEFQFDFDPCPHPRPAGFDGLKEDWGKVNWVNPPVVAGTSLTNWTKKAIIENQKGRTVAMVFPTPRYWFGLLVTAGAEIRNLGRVNWRNPQGRHDGAHGHESILFILRGKP